MSSSFCDVNGQSTDKYMYGPGDKILSLHARPPLGSCSPTLHFMGYWWDQTKFGPLVYLNSTNLVNEPKSPKKAPRSVPQLEVGTATLRWWASERMR